MEENRIHKWLLTTKIMKMPRNFLVKFIVNAIEIKNGYVSFYFDPTRSLIINKIKKIKLESDMQLYLNEAYQIYMAVKSTAKIEGNVAEVGTYKGGSAKLICLAKGNKPLHIFDTFTGLPEVSQIDDTNRFHGGDYTGSLELVKSYLEDCNNVFFYKGYFPETAKPVENKTFSFVHLDVDLYESTKSCIEFFYPRLSKGGIMISHNYIDAIGVRKAFDEFFKNKPEPVIEMSGTQCLIVKV